MLATVTYYAKRERLQVPISYLQSCQILFIEKLQLLCFNPVAFWTLPSRLFSHRHIYHSFMGHCFGWIPALQCAHSRSVCSLKGSEPAVYNLECKTKMCNLHNSDKNNWKTWPFKLTFLIVKSPMLSEPKQKAERSLLRSVIPVSVQLARQQTLPLSKTAKISDLLPLNCT